MKVLSLWQPWATLCVIGAKHIETRSFSTNYRGPILIHSSQKMAKEHKAICEKQPFKSALAKVEELPLGCIIGKVDIVEVAATRSFVSISLDKITSGWAAQINWKQELAFGDYADGRYGWLLQNPVAFKHHVPFSGGVGLTREFNERICMICGCTDNDCRHCIEKTGQPCWWATDTVCSACAGPF